MNENVPASGSGPLFFPAGPENRPARTVSADGANEQRLEPSALSLDPLAIQAMSEAEMQQEALRMLACLKRQSLAEVAAGAAHTDGTLAIKSMIAVWILSTVGKAFGRRLVRLSEVDRDALRSVGGVARLIKQTRAGQLAIGAA